jgi:hypothetical protein
LAENPTVSEQTIMALAGHVSKSMLARYSHIRVAVKQAAIDTLESERMALKPRVSGVESPQNPPQSAADTDDQISFVPERALN